MRHNVNRIYLRALEPDDYKSIFKWRHDPIYQSGVASMKRYVSMDTERKWIDEVISKHEKGDEIRLGIVQKEANELIGLIYLTNINYINKNAMISFMIGENDLRGRGFVNEAQIEILKYAFYELGLERIYAHILESNTSSIKSVEKFGYAQEGILRNAVYKEGKFQNVVIYSILKQEFINKYFI